MGNNINSVEKALDILQVVLNSKSGVSLSDLVYATGFNISTVHRLSSILVTKGYLYKGGKKDKFSIGHQLIRLSDTEVITSIIEETSFRFLEKLADDVSETVCVSILDGVEALNIVVISNRNTILQVVPEVGNRLPLHCTAAGKILLAYMPKERMQGIVRFTKFTANTEKTIINNDRLEREIKKIKRNGVAIDNGEYLSGVVSVAAPIKGKNDNLLAVVCCAAPKVRMSRARFKLLIPKVISCAHDISRSLGYKSVVRDS